MRIQLVEEAPAAELFSHPQHPYTRALISAMPLPDPIREACTLAGIPVETAASARQLGQACGISVAATAAGVI